MIAFVKEADAQVIKRIKNVSVIIMFIIVALIIRTVLTKDITSIDDFQSLVNSYGIAGPVFLTLFQAFQVVIPILPGYIGCAAGAISYGAFVGFLCNYIGITMGSIIAFFLAERYGVTLVKDLFSTKYYEKWKARIEKRKFYDAFLFVATLLPMFPDDFLCYFSGLIKMDRKKFIKIIILGKPWCIMAYSIIFGLIN